MKLYKIHITATILLATMFVACTKDGDTIYVPDPTDAASTTPLVTVIYDPDALGDHSYNDLIYQGVEKAANEYHVRTMQLSPTSREEGLAYLETIFKQMSTRRDTIRRLFIVTSTAYDSWLRQNNRRLENNPYADLLYFETSTPLEGKGSTLQMPYYGAMYEAGAITTQFSDEVLLIGANRENKSVAEGMQGFQDGFATNYISPREEKRLVVEYIGQHQDEGFSISDSLALRMMTKYDWNRYSTIPMIVPICGGAGMSFQRMSEVLIQFLFMGVDVVKLSGNCPYSAVKHIDRAVKECVRQWLSPEGMPKHQSLGLVSGYTEVCQHPISSIFTMMYQDEISDELRQVIHEEAIRKEEAYGK